MSVKETPDRKKKKKKKNAKLAVVLLPNVVVVIICWHERYLEILHEVHSSLVLFCLTFESFYFSLIVFVPLIYLDNRFLRKAMIAIALNTSPNVLLMFNICRCL